MEPHLFRKAMHAGDLDRYVSNMQALVSLRAGEVRENEMGVRTGNNGR